MASGRMASRGFRLLLPNFNATCLHHSQRHFQTCFSSYCRNLMSPRLVPIRSIQPIHQGVRQHHICRRHDIQCRVLPSGSITNIRRSYSTGDGSHHKPIASEPTSEIQENVSPFKMVEEELATLCDDIKMDILCNSKELYTMTAYHFDGKGKSFRPTIILLLAKAVNFNNELHSLLLSSQRKVAMIAEMIHTASLVHDDVIDEAETRRGKPSVQNAWGQKKAILTGDFILSLASIALARLRNDECVKILSQVLEDLVRGEFMQLGSKEDESERFNHYLMKTYKKTASLIANSCKAVAVLAESTEDVLEHAYQYGRNIGIAFQLVDDLLDFISSEALMGKPTAADLKLGLATAPVLFAAQQFPELDPMIMRRFQEPGDVEKAWQLVSRVNIRINTQVQEPGEVEKAWELSDGVAHTRFLAEQHCKEAIRQICHLADSRERRALVELTNQVLNRLK